MLHGRSLRHFERFFNVASQHDCKISDECSIISRIVPRASPQIQFFRNCQNNASSPLRPPFVVDVKYLSCVSNFEIMMFFPVLRSFVKTGKKDCLERIPKSSLFAVPQSIGRNLGPHKGRYLFGIQTTVAKICTEFLFDFQGRRRL